METAAQNSRRSVAEDLVLAGLKAQVLVPSDAEYSAREDSYWSNTAKIAPGYIVRPKSAEEVSTTIQALVATKQKFAIRSGGHTPYAGAANIQGGVTVDLGLLNWTRFNEISETVDLGPGGRWGPVYEELRKHGRVVAGGRDGHVGVCGLLLGGGKTFFTARRGLACNDVVSYEVVLADGSIVTVDDSNHVDLFQALKGGMNNFGIVTNIRMRSFTCGDVWAGLNFYPKETIPDAAEALTNFTKNVPNDMDSNLLCFFTYTGMYKQASLTVHWRLT